MDIQTKVYEYLIGTCEFPTQVIDYFGLDWTARELEEKMLELNLERCPGCGYWVESWELVDEKDEPKLCDNCEPLKEF